MSLRRTGRATLDGIRLYGSASWREVNPAPLDRLVRPVLPGDAAHLEHVSTALRH